MSEVLDIPCRDVVPMPGQPRKWFDPAKLAALAESIREVGQLVPAKVVRLGPGRYELVDGERRWRATKLAGLRTLRAEVVDEPDTEVRYAMSAAANFQRADNHPLEIAAVCERMRRTMTVERVAAVLGKSVPYVYQYLLLLNLEPSLVEQLNPETRKGHGLPFSAAIKLARLPREQQVGAWEAAQRSDQAPMRAVELAMAEMPETKERQRFLRGAVNHLDLPKTLQAQLRRTLYGLEKAGPRFAATMRHTTAARAEAIRAHLRGLIDLATKLLESEGGDRA